MNNKNNEELLHIGIVGFGMVGGSLCTLISKYRPDLKLSIVEPNPGYRDIAFDRHPASPVNITVDILADCDLVIVANYVADVAQTVANILALDRFKGLVLDTGSVKAPIIRDVLSNTEVASRYIPGHPMAGRNEPGPQTASADIMDGKTFLLCHHPQLEIKNLSAVDEFLRSINFNTHQIRAEDHDAILSLSSHLPHILAYTIAGQIDELGSDMAESDFNALCGRSIRTIVDFASPNFTMWEQIVCANKTAILHEGRRLVDNLEEFLAAIDDEDTDCLRDLFRQGASGRSRLLK
jgi:prephenate dehydrogenase